MCYVTCESHTTCRSHVTRKRVMAHMQHALSFMLYVTCFISPVGLTLYVWVTSHVNESWPICDMHLVSCCMSRVLYHLWVSHYMYESRHVSTSHVLCVTCESHTVYMSCESHSICMSCIDTVCDYIYSVWLYIWIVSHTYMYEYIYSVWLYVWVVTVYMCDSHSHTLYIQMYTVYMSCESH